MTFISYAQNYEDVMLHRALKDVDKGFYIDVGANDPVSDSVTKAFYDAGWRGINIEPVSEWFEKLELDRPEDINLQVAAGARKGNATFYEVLGTGLSTMDKSIAERHVKEQSFETKQYNVPVVRLTSVCEQYACSDIHFLKVDVEGSEQFVLQGLNLKKIRPWIILIESTLPNLQIESYDKWESILLTSDYEYCYFDGLNRFYVAKEHHVLKNSLSVPPNVFDGFFLSGKSSNIVHHQVRDLQAEIASGANQKQAMESALQQAEQQQQELNSQLQGLQVEVTRHQELLRQKESKEQALFLALIEKETKQQESNAQIAEHKQQINQLHTELTRNGEQRQALESALQQTEQQQQELNLQLQGLQVEVTRHQELLRQKENKEQALLLALIEKETKQQESNAQIAEHKQQINQLHTELTRSGEQKQAMESALQQAEQQQQELNSQSQGLQVEVTRHQEFLLRKDEAIQNLIEEIEAAKQKIDELNQSNHKWWSMADQNNKELIDAHAKTDELNQSSHHWWLEAERLNKELEAVYHSKSWIITWPLRKLSQFVQWLFYLPIQFMLQFIRLPRRIARWFLVKVMAYALKHPRLKERAMNGLRNHPKLEMKLRQLALARRFADGDLDPDLSSLTPSARRIYGELKAALAQHKKENG